jgi:hypothetical protein
VVSRVQPVEAAYIYPHFLTEQPLVADKFWSLLKLFWTDEEVDEWKASTVRGEVSILDTCENGICLWPSWRRTWNTEAGH